jgi:hypothetical protein
MSLVERVQSQIECMSTGELVELRGWLDAHVWDRQFELDVKTGKLDELATRALAEHDAGNSTPL